MCHHVTRWLSLKSTLMTEKRLELSCSSWQRESIAWYVAQVECVCGLRPILTFSPFTHFLQVSAKQQPPVHIRTRLQRPAQLKEAVSTKLVLLLSSNVSSELFPQVSNETRQKKQCQTGNKRLGEKIHGARWWITSCPFRFLSQNLISSLSPGVFRDLHQLEWL